MFKAVEIEGERYWDGGFSGNPALYPLIYQTRRARRHLAGADQPDRAPLTLPDTAQEIMNA